MDRHLRVTYCPHHHHHHHMVWSFFSERAIATLRRSFRRNCLSRRSLRLPTTLTSRGQRKDRAGEEVRHVPHGRVPEAPPSQRSWPPCLGDLWWPQERIQHRTLKQLADVVPMVQVLDIPVPQLVDQLVDVLRFFATLLLVPEQAVEVPKILLDDVPVRTAVRVTQLAEQLVEVPTIVFLVFVIAAGLFQLLVVEGEFLVFKVFPLNRDQQRCILLLFVFLCGLWSRSLIFPVEAFKSFAQDRVHPLLRMFQLVFMVAWMSLVKVFFRTFPQLRKSAKLGPHSSQRVPSVSAHPCWRLSGLQRVDAVQ